MKHLALIFLLFATVSTSHSLIKPQKVLVNDGVIWSFDFIDDKKVIYSVRSGELYLYNLKTKKRTLIKSPTVYSSGQGGLLDVHHQKVNDKDYIYITYSEEVNGRGTTSLARALYNNGTPSAFQRIFRAKTNGDSSRHFGSRLVFVNDGLFMTIGDRAERKEAQNLKLHNGKILKLTFDGKPHPSNPFLNNKSALPEIWSFGHRNPQGIDIDPTTGKLWSCEFGPRGGDELNLIRKGKNYGWPKITYGKEYWGPKIGPTHKKGMLQPIAHWTPSISPSGMVFYTGDKLPFTHHIAMAALGSRHIRFLKIENNKVIDQIPLLQKFNQRIRHVRNGPNGHLYFSTDSGGIYRLTPPTTNN